MASHLFGSVLLDKRAEMPEIYLFRSELPNPTQAGNIFRSIHFLHLLGIKITTSKFRETLRTQISVVTSVQKGSSEIFRKRLWGETNDVEQLGLAIRYYTRGYEIRRDYYNGENLATCLDYRAEVQLDQSEAEYDHKTATKVRESLVENLSSLIKLPSFEDRSDRRWIFATLANSSFALGSIEIGNEYETKFFAESPAQWEIDTYTEGKAGIM